MYHALTLNGNSNFINAVKLSDIAAGIDGFVIIGESAGDYSGHSVSSAGDVNGDGLDDLIVGLVVPVRMLAFSSPR
jgi:hypothetical protein